MKTLLKKVTNLCRLVLHNIKQIYIHYRIQMQGILLEPSTMVKGHCHIQGNVKIGRDTIIQSALLDGRGGITIGNSVIIDQATVLTAQHDINSPDYETTYAPVEIGDYAILYQHSVVLPGRIIGRGAIIAVGAIVTHNVPEMAIVAGNPARIIRYRKCVHSNCDLQLMGGFNIRKQIYKRIFRSASRNK